MTFCFESYRRLLKLESVSILIPYRPDNGPRDQAFKWVKKYYKALMPEAELCIGSCKYRIFSRAQAINDAAAKATGNIFVIADSDIFYDPNIIEASINLLDQYPWVIPYNTIKRISENSSNDLYKTEPEFPIKMNLECGITCGFQGGLNIVPRLNFEKVGGFDERFCGWGGEDDAFAHSLNTLCGRYIRLDHEILHLWHPPFSGYEGLEDKNSIYQLFLRYLSANGNLESMRNLIEERKTDLCGECYKV
jgi:hypothetical protein